MSVTSFGALADSSVASSALVATGEIVTQTVKVTRDAIIAFSQASLDTNPLHVDDEAASRAGFPTIIASGQHTAALLMGLLATHFSRGEDGVAREMLCLNMNFSFKAPVFAERDLTLYWRVTHIEWKSRLGGMLAQLDGSASQRDSSIAVVARGTILVKSPSSQAAVNVFEDSTFLKA
jgi:acyl dehydratase